MASLIELSWQAMASFAANRVNILSTSLVEASGFGAGRFAANRANTTSKLSIWWGSARSAIDHASASSGRGMEGLFANEGSGLSWAQIAAALASGNISSISESIGEGLRCHFIPEMRTLPELIKYIPSSQ